jgi:2-oxoglutarate dehydrogenase E2 component (dihydrolipoamide succinyltransferase)
VSTDTPLPWRVRTRREPYGFISPAVKRVAAERGIDPTAISGSGTNGRVTLRDLPEAGRGEEAGTGASETVPFNNIRKRAAGMLLASKQTSAHTLCTARADYSAIEAVRRRERTTWREREGFSLTYLPFVARAVVDALHDYPLMNAAVGNDSLIVRKRVNLGIAVDLDFQGLVVPVVHDADGLRMRALAHGIHDVATRARAKKLTPDDLSAGTFTITNPGGSGTWMSFPIINQPQVGILATDGVSKQVIIDDHGAMRIAPVGHLCLTFDHRALDGAYAASFLARVKEIVETRDWSAEL